MRIIGPPSVPRASVLARLQEWQTDGRVHARFVDEMFEPLWRTAHIYGIDPVGIVAQSYKETAGGKFGGRIDHRWCNTCGLKIRHVGIVPAADGGRALAHAMFASWAVGALAHVQHVCAYAGLRADLICAAFPEVPIVDPRFELVSGPPLENWWELSGRWAPSPTYGSEIEAVMTLLR